MMPEKVDVALIMGSKSDKVILEPFIKKLREYQVSIAYIIASAHRTPKDVADFVKECYKRGCKAFAGAAGLAAHLPGVIAANTIRPVIGVPLSSKDRNTAVNGLDALLSIVQMPTGIPVSAVAIDATENAAIAILEILATFDQRIEQKLITERRTMRDKIAEDREQLDKEWG
jgi:5-(carboxyamino)imidazole ribonucleotide mutase